VGCLGARLRGHDGSEDETVGTYDCWYQSPHAVTPNRLMSGPRITAARFPGTQTFDIRSINRMIEVEPGKWGGLTRGRFPMLILQHVVNRGYEARGLMWRLMCQRIRDALPRMVG
jgi:hypothetical protein